MDDEPPAAIHPLVRDASERGDPHHDPWFLTGDPLMVLDALRRTHGRRIELVYIDAPRLETDATSFDAFDANARLDTWLTVMQGLIRRGMRLLSDRGAIVVLCGIAELPYVQILLNEYGPQNHVGTIAWQKGYSPRNMPNMREISATHDNLVIFARRKESLSAVALRVPTEGFANPDDDPRGPWKAEHKGAHKPDCDYEVNIPPYRWRLVEGELPPGAWRVNPKSGVIWAKALTAAGSWEFTIEVEDKSGARARKGLSITVREDAQSCLADIPWLISKASGSGAPATSGPLQVLTDRLPDGRVGGEYSAVVLAKGGQPWVGTTRPGKTSASGKGRYWEFPEGTLLRSAAQDDVDFKNKDDAIPALKIHEPPGASGAMNQASTWLGRGKGDDDSLGVGYSHDAKQELEELRKAGLIADIVRTSKPSRLVLRLIALFSRAGGLVVDVGSPAAEMAAYATAAGRRALYVEFGESKNTRASVTLPRLRCASQGKHPLPSGVLFGRALEGDGARAFIVDGAPREASVQAGVCAFVLGLPAVALDRQLGVATFEYESYETTSVGFLEALASVEGLIPTVEPCPDHFADRLGRRLRAAYVSSAEILDGRMISRLEDMHEDFLKSGGRLRIYYHRGQDANIQPLGSRVELRRIPFDLQVMAGLI